MARLLQPISWLQRTAGEITEHDLKRRIPVRGNDDLAALTTTVNGMLDRLESTVEAQKSLLDDVGHELRTPMTIVRGHLELMTRPTRRTRRSSGPSRSRSSPA